jgi:hypothetical protein
MPRASISRLMKGCANTMKFSNQAWNERRGYRIICHVEKLFQKVDSTGKTWYWNAVFLKKNI